MNILNYQTNKRNDVVDLTDDINKLVRKTNIVSGFVIIYVPHATAAITINENYDPNISQDLLNYLSDSIPQGIWKHDVIDGNADAHIKAAIIGPSETILIDKNELLLGNWQNIFLLDFDGPKKRN